ncbi:uncharacterized protein LDX57_009512 [Aspergillus melleus]|uniref:uncharacterized protein n=1 Tax=Aspergillus melleus TaxID=138277 RepID=UPI001E8D6890|nr:uncharacterized protein LDX57_009512 [Aspergillus melleus]KAH8431861.1 hypothetical protein LDX57_009512 [Aspergillus melleus]
MAPRTRRIVDTRQSLMATGITPTGGFQELPLTPPLTNEKLLSRSAQRVLNHFKLHKAGHRPRFWWQHQLSLRQYAEALRALNSDNLLRSYVEDKVRYDYDPCRSSLIIRMPSVLHDVFCAKIVEEILRQLKQLENGDEDCASFAKEVQHLATSRIMIPDETRDGKQVYSKREPDASFKHRLARFPGVIIADEYILNTDGSVNAVVALDIDYKGSQKAAITVWRPEYITVDGVEELQATAKVDALPFRTESGLPVEGAALQLSLRDFATEELSRGHTSIDQEIFITSDQLCAFLSRAEEEQRGQMLHQGSINSLRPGARKRRRSPPPPDQPSSDEEGSGESEREYKRGRQSSDFCPDSSSGDLEGELL